MMKRPAIALRLPKRVQAHNFAVSVTIIFLIFLTAPLQGSQSHSFFGKYHSEMKCFFVEYKQECLSLLNRNSSHVNTVQLRQQETS